MAHKSFTIRDFSGGLNTAKEPELLAPNQSPDLSNIELLTSGSMRSRKGYSSVFASQFTTQDIHTLHRHYSTDGTKKMWVAFAGTHAYTTDGVTQMWTVAEAENLSITGTYTLASGASYSSGSVVSASLGRVIGVTTPSCTRISVVSNSASIRIDGGAWVSTSGSYQSSTLTATHHHVEVYSPANKYNKVTKVTHVSSPWTAEKVFTDYGGGVYALEFYDDGSNTQSSYIRLANSYSSYSRYASLGIGVGPSENQAYYSIRLGSVVAYENVASRSNGWHTLEFRLSSDRKTVFVYLDGTLVKSANEFPNATSTFKFTMYGAGSKHLHIDNFSYKGVVYDNGTATNYWAIDPAGTSVTSIDDPAGRLEGGLLLDTVSYISGGLMGKADSTLSASTQQFSAVSYLGKVYYASSYDKLRQMTQSGTSSAVVALSGTTPMGGFLVQHKDRLWITGSADNYNTLVRISRVSDPTSWDVTTLAASAAQANAVSPNSGQTCTGLVVMNDEVYQFTNAGVYKFSTSIESNSYVVDPTTLSTKYGCIAPKSLAVAPNMLVWLGADAVYTYGMLAGVNPLEGGAFGVLSDDIKPTIDSITDKTKPVGIIYDGRYWIAVDTDGDGLNSTVLVYRFPEGEKAGAWTRYTYPNLDIKCFYTTRGDEFGLYAGCADGVMVKMDEGYSDNGSAIEWYYKTPPLAPASYSNVKKFSVLHLATKSDSVQNIELSFETDDTTPPPQTVAVDASSASKPKRVLIPSRGRYIAARFGAAASNQDTSIDSMTMTFNESPLR